MASQMKNTAPASIQKLVETFEKNLPEYQSRKNETELRREFLDKFFTALGWDVDNLQGAREAEKEVAHEFSVEIDGQQKKADYAFRIKRDSAIAEKFDFLVEAKKPSVKIESNLDAAFQIRRYGWSARIPINILTDFEHFAVYDCRVKPKYGEKAVLNRQMLFHYKEYIEKWDEIVSLFSPEAVRTGSLSEYVKSIKGKKGTADVDDDFLQEIERWRELLAKNIASNNEWIDISGLNYAVQMIIDRIIFLRICEERSIEPENQLQDITNKENIYKELCSLFKRADTKYNSGLFHFAKESGEASRADDLTLRLDIDDKTLKDIILNLYYPKSPYAFLYIPSDILGQVYERFLGKVIRLTDGHRAKVEEKPEVRKAGGVFYTPTFIVTYIVINTLGKLLLGLTPKEAVKLKIVDPACGSGTFLLGAFEYLLAWHLKWYSENDPKKWVKNKVIVKVENDYRLTTSKKKEILLNNIYGVDIDAQAVEVTKLSLLLKVLENASGQLELGMERILPDLGNNIKCGNSLVGEDYFSEFPEMTSQEERIRINPFNWESAFPEVFAQGGFDVVIGNPPYVRMESFKELKDYFRKNYACHEERSDIYAYIIEQSHKILKSGGLFGMIVSNKFLRANYGKPLRDFIQKNANVKHIIDFAGLPVFKGATVRTIILLTSREPQKEFLQYAPPMSIDMFSNVESGKATVENIVTETTYPISSTTLGKDIWSFSESNLELLLEKIQESSISLEKYCNGQIGYGIKSGLDKAFVITEEQKQSIIQQDKNSETIIKPYLNGRDVRRYFVDFKQRYLIYTNHGIDIKKYSGIENYMKPYKAELQKRATKQEWFELQQPQFNYAPFFDGSKIVLPDIAMEPRFALDETGYYGATTIFFIPLRDLYLLGLLNSKLGFIYFRQTCAALEGKNDVYLRFKRQYLAGFPVHPINFSIPAEKSAHDKIVSLVESMLAFHKSLASTQNPFEKERLEKQIKSADEGIDKSVYELYGLSQEEIKIVEGK
jgi:type I restriction-modification system DNA methylase subunit